MPRKTTWRKLKLWRRDPHCHWCGVRTVLPTDNSGRQFATLATLDHLDNRLSKDRVKNKHHTERTVLACAACNSERGRLACTHMYKEEHRLRSSRCTGAGMPMPTVVRRMGVRRPLT